MILKNTKQKAFTIVELLIVIVVIGILAAISIVAYNGIQDRSRNTSVANAASQVRNKVEVYNSITGGYPTPAQIDGGLAHSDAPTEAKIDADVANMITTGTIGNTHSTTNNLIRVATCTGGIVVQYFQNGTTNGEHRLGCTS